MLLIFFIDIITSVISSTQIACDVMVFTRKNKRGVCFLIKELYNTVSYCIKFETNKYIYRNGYMRGC